MPPARGLNESELGHLTSRRVAADADAAACRRGPLAWKAIIARAGVVSAGASRGGARHVRAWRCARMF